MTCTRTGCHIWIEPYREYAYGDAFEIEPILEKDSKIWRQLQQLGFADKIKNIAYFNLVARSFTPINGMAETHFIIHDFTDWFNRGDIEQQLRNSMLITNNYTRETRII